jgi:hypothetical protein
MVGVSIFIAVAARPSDVRWKCLAIYTPILLVEWLILAGIIRAGIIRRKSDNKSASAALQWCICGIVVSFVADFASPEGATGHFCVGRCLR